MLAEEAIGVAEVEAVKMRAATEDAAVQAVVDEAVEVSAPDSLPRRPSPPFSASPSSTPARASPTRSQLLRVSMREVREASAKLQAAMREAPSLSPSPLSPATLLQAPPQPRMTLSSPLLWPLPSSPWSPPMRRSSLLPADLPADRSLACLQTSACQCAGCERTLAEQLLLKAQQGLSDLKQELFPQGLPPAPLPVNLKQETMDPGLARVEACTIAAAAALRMNDVKQRTVGSTGRVAGAY